MTYQVIKKCPFCGGEANPRLRSGDERNAYSHCVIVSCGECGANVSAEGDTSKGGYADNSTVFLRAVNKWNQRVEDSHGG